MVDKYYSIGATKVEQCVLSNYNVVKFTLKPDSQNDVTLKIKEQNESKFVCISKMTHAVVVST